MFSGGDSSESLNQLGAYGFVNQVAVSNAMAAGRNIDWAQLAQQWIQMRDNATSDTSASNMNENKIPDHTCSGSKFEEKGEADMDMDDEEQQSDEKTLQKSENSFSSATVVHHNNLTQPWFFSDGTSHLDPQSTSGNQWSTWNNRDALEQQTTPVNSNINNPTSHIPSLLKMNVPHPNEIRIMHDTPNQPEDATNMVDSAKRKVLPAWIREGLEKMEREKQRQIEREKQNKRVKNKWSDDDSEKTKDILSKSKAFEKGEERETLYEDSTDNESTVQNIETNEKNDIKHDEGSSLYSVLADKTYEQKLEDLMIVVRRTLTELLLETTNEEISKVADDTIKSFKWKASSAQVIQKSALSTITGKLGLAAYADSSSEENSDDEGQIPFKSGTYQSESDIDSEEELRNTIRTKRRAFVKISDEIEERVSSAAAREEEKLRYFSRKEEEKELEITRKKQENSLNSEAIASVYSGKNNKGYEKDFGEITETKIQSFNGKRQKDRNSRKERTTRFSDNKDKYVALPATASFIANINVTGATGSGGNSATTVAPSTNLRQNIPDINGLLPSYTSTGMKNVLNAADAALEKVLKRKSSESPKKQSKRHDRSRDYSPIKKRQRHSSSSKHSRSRSKSNSSTSYSSSSTSTSSSESGSSSSSRSSHHSKYSHRLSTKHKSHSSSRKNYNKSHKDHKDHRNYSSLNTKKDRGSASRSHYGRNGSSDSDEEYSRPRRHDSHYSHISSQSRRYTSSRHDREHSRSLSRSSYSSSSNRRQ